LREDGCSPPVRCWLWLVSLSRGHARLQRGATPPSVRRITAATLRQTKSALPALMVTVIALSIGARHDIQEWELGAGLAHRHGAGDPMKTQKDQARIGLGGHVSIVLLSAPEKQQFFCAPGKKPAAAG